MNPGGRSKPITLSQLNKNSNGTTAYSNNKPMYIGASNIPIPSPTDEVDHVAFPKQPKTPPTKEVRIIEHPSEDVRICVNEDEAMTSPHHNCKSSQSSSTDSLRSNSNGCCSIYANGGYNPILFFSLAYFLSAFMFLLTINLYMLPNLYYPTIGNLLPLDILHNDPRRTVILIILWGFHYVRRFGEVLFVHVYKRGVPLIEAVGSIIYYSFFGFWVGWSVNYHIDYRTPPDYIFIPGILLCIFGGVGNFICHLQLRGMRKSKRRRHSYIHPVTKHVIPSGGCFNFISCPHYLFEIVLWLGFAIAAFTLAAWTFCIAVIMTLFVYSYKKHSAYKSEFNGENDVPLFPKNRKALVPFIF